MKRILTFPVAIIFLCLMACNNGTEKTAEEATIANSMPPASFKIVMIEHPVADFQTWKTAYLAHDSVRQSYGVSHYLYGRNMNDSGKVIVIDKFSDITRANEFKSLPELKTVMEKAGVTGMPVFTFAEVIRNDDTKIDYPVRALIAHRVKDFDTWLEVFDAEGMNTRKEFGLLDRMLARGIEDPNMVYIIFALSDLEKAKTRIVSDELEKLMIDAGVEGTPVVTYYQFVE